MVGGRPQVANGLHWLRQELEHSLTRTRAGVEQYLETPSDKQPLLAALDELRLVRGTVGMIECFGAQLLAEEMAFLLRDLLDERIAHPDEAFAALSGATLQLSDYIDLLAHGEEDRVLVLQPIVNELRLARGKPVLTEADLFARQMQALEAIVQEPAEGAPLDPMASQGAARRELPQFQVRFLQWFRGQNTVAALQELAQAAARMSAVSVSPKLHDFWAAAAALAESMPPAVTESIDVKRLYGRVGTLLKLEAEQGEESAEAQLGDVTHHLLLYLGRVPKPSERARALIEQYRLAAFLPSPDTLDDLRRRLRGPNTTILDRVYEEIRHDFAQIKDAIDLAVRTGGRAQTGFAAIGEKMQRLANTIGMLGLQVPKQALLNQARSLEGLDPASPAWIDVATAILRVEHALEEALFRALGSGDNKRPERTYAEIEADIPPSQDVRESVAALLRESFVNLALLKTAVDNYLKSSEATTLSQAPTLLHEVAAGLVIYGRDAAAELVGKLEAYARSGALTALSGNLAEAERFADAIACVEVYFEALRDGLPQTERILKDLEGFIECLELREPESALALLTAPKPVAEPVVAAAPAAEEEMPSLEVPASAGETVPTLAAAAAPPPDLRPAPAAPSAVPTSAPVPVTATAAPAEAEIDPEIREIFIEEASEVLGQLQEQVPIFVRDPRDQALLGDIRRAFHTLKGSGRMVGAKGIGEFSWAIEQMLNRCLEGSLAVRAPVLETVEGAVALLPELLDSFRAGITGESPKAGHIIDRAQALVAGRTVADSDMMAVFREDARERLTAVGRWLEQQDPHQAAIPVPGELVRAFHTLRGSAAIVDATSIAAISGSIENYLNMVQLAEQSLSPPALALLADVVLALRGWVETFGTPDAVRADVSPWLQRVEALQSELTSAAGTRRSAAESYTFAALDEVQQIEAFVFAWVSKPTERPPELTATLDALGVTAARAGDSATVRVAMALSARLSQSPKNPDTAYFERVGGLVESLYQSLDSFRSGTAASVEPVLVQIAELPVAAALTADEELRQIFRGEAEELMQEAEQSFATWRSSPTNTSAGDSIRRVLHTLKGSARMAEVAPIGEICQRLEDLVRDFTSGNFDSGMRALEAGLNGLQGMLGEFDRGETPREAPVLMAINAALGIAPVEPVVEEAPQEVAAAPVVAEEEVPAPAVEPLPVEEAPSYIEEPVLAAEPEPAEPVVEPPLMEMIAEPPAPAVEVVAEEPVIEEPAVVEPVAEEPAIEEPAVAAEAELEEELVAQPPVEEPAEPMIEAAAPVEPPVAVEEPAEEPVLQAPVFEEAPAPVVHEPVEARIQPPAKETREAEPASWMESTLTPLIQMRSTQPAAPTFAEIVAQGDSEMIEIFVAEATELLEALDTGIDAWQNGEETESVRDILRTLHTLKGGARMASIDAMGEAAHELETFVNEVVARGEFPDASSFRRLRAEFETLQAMHDRLQRGEPVVAPAKRPEEAREAPAVAEAAAEMAAKAEERVEKKVEKKVEPRIEVPRVAAGPAPAWNPELFWKPDEELIGVGLARRESARVPVETLDAMLNHAGEISIYRSRLEQQNVALQTQLNEMTQTVSRIREQLRMMDIETDAQIAARGLSAAAAGGGGLDRYAQDFDPLEMDRYSRMQELSRALAESINDLASLRASMDDVVSEADTLLQQQGRINSEVQQGLMGTLMVPFSRQAPRLQRVVRQTASENGKQADIVFSGVEAELDRNVLERMTAPLEHLLRNSVVHGIETPEERIKVGKRVTGEIHIMLRREGTQLVVDVADDGAGLNYEAIRRKAVERGLMPADASLPDEEVGRFIFEPGFSTARELTKDAGRGIGMDVVASEVKQLAGTLELASETGKGTHFLIRLPLTLAVSHALLVSIGQDAFALPLASVEGIARVPRKGTEDLLAENAPPLSYAGHSYPVRYLGDLVDLPRQISPDARALTAILMRVEGLGAGERRIAVVVDQLIGNREIVSKAVGPQISSVPGVSGATILPDGRVVLILDVPALVAERARRALLAEAAAVPKAPEAVAEVVRETIMVVDDSVTMRRIAERLLERHGFRVTTAKDGLDAMALLQTETPSTVLLDIEMPRADGFEVAAFIRNTPRLSKIPIIMITSRSGEKHRERARSLGVNRYLIKPYQEDQLLAEVNSVRTKAS
jgi:chemosensory pili system protein ChpA (sensor histidine kinase/response regulator)